MPTLPFTSPVEDSVPKVENDNDAIAVGEDLQFQRKWWRFERVIWALFFIILLCDVLGLFGRGWLAKSKATTPALTLNYERIERAGTPSVMTLRFTEEAIHDGKILVWVSDSLVKALGAQRISPQPATSTVGDEGILYTFYASRSPAEVQIALEPSFPGLHTFVIKVAGNQAVARKVVVLP